MITVVPSEVSTGALHNSHIYIFKFIFLERGRERERTETINQITPTHTYGVLIKPTTWACALTRNQTPTSWCMGPHPTEPHQLDNSLPDFFTFLHLQTSYLCSVLCSTEKLSTLYSFKVILMSVWLVRVQTGYLCI